MPRWIAETHYANALSSARFYIYEEPGSFDVPAETFAAEDTIDIARANRSVITGTVLRAGDDTFDAVFGEVTMRFTPASPDLHQPEPLPSVAFRDYLGRRI